MRFPTNITIKLTNQAEHDELINALRGWAVHLEESEDAGDLAIFSSLLERVKYVDSGNVVTDMPDAYVEVSGKRIKEGKLDDMSQLFNNEIITHRASVVLFQRDIGLTYKAIKTRSAQR